MRQTTTTQAVLNNGCYEWVTRSVRGWGEAMFPNEPLVKTYEYINTMFYHCKQKHKEFLDKIKKELYLDKCDEIKSHRDRIKSSTVTDYSKLYVEET